MPPNLQNFCRQFQSSNSPPRQNIVQVPLARRKDTTSKICQLPIILRSLSKASLVRCLTSLSNAFHASPKSFRVPGYTAKVQTSKNSANSFYHRTLRLAKILSKFHDCPSSLRSLSKSSLARIRCPSLSNAYFRTIYD